MLNVSSTAYALTYGGLPVHRWWRRNHKGTPQTWPNNPRRCIDEQYRYIGNNPCPICRDEYLWFDFRVSLQRSLTFEMSVIIVTNCLQNFALIEQFLQIGTLKVCDLFLLKVVSITAKMYAVHPRRRGRPVPRAVASTACGNIESGRHRLRHHQRAISQLQVIALL